MMYRKFIAIILATAVAITGLSAAPARAGDNDVLKVLGGVAAIAIIGAAIADAKDRDDKVTRGHTYHHRNRHPNRHRHHAHTHRDRGHHNAHRHNTKPRALPHRVQRKLLPASCRVQARNRGDNFLAYSNWCLQRKFRHSNALPGRCAVNARVLHNNKRSVVYSSRCLSRYGYAAAQY